MFKMPGQKSEVDGVHVIKALRLQVRRGVCGVEEWMRVCVCVRGRVGGCGLPV